ncbi:hypothetical protein JXQ31_20035 [candidate division KSB1 bacterium]|nr:hypothetical protein [candidate division KSB1 bacterium]
MVTKLRILNVFIIVSLVLIGCGKKNPVKSNQNPVTYNYLSQIDQSLNVISFVDNNIGVAIGNEYKKELFIRTIDGGAHWYAIDQFVSDFFGPTDICFIDKNIGFIIGGCRSYQTKDQGNTWSYLDIDNFIPWHWAGLYYYSIKFFDKNNGIIVGTIVNDSYSDWEGLYLHTEDGGVTWKAVTINQVEDSPGSGYGWFISSLDKVAYINANKAIALGNNHAFYLNNNGESCNIISGLTLPDIADIVFPSSDLGIAVGPNGLIVRSTNQGLSWSNIASGINHDLTGVYFTNQNVGYIVGINGIILKTINGGLTWSPKSSGTNATLTDLYFTDTNNGVIIGDKLILRTTNGGESWDKVL